MILRLKALVIIPQTRTKETPNHPLVPIHLRTVRPERTLNHLTNTVLAVKHHTEQIPNRLMELKPRLAAMVNLKALGGGKEGNSAAGDVKDTPPAATNSGNGGRTGSKDEKPGSKPADRPKADDSKTSLDGKVGLGDNDKLDSPSRTEDSKIAADNNAKQVWDASQPNGGFREKYNDVGALVGFVNSVTGTMVNVVCRSRLYFR
ncbi:hypothetical protein CPB85DRAFT_154627 [Mucidula mucida]|nr:hypothetical protein CPB85DRAFT_154627 [Mucidula mucida]